MKIEGVNFIPGKWIRNKVDVDELKMYDLLIQMYCAFENEVLSFSERSLLSYYTKWGVNKHAESNFKSDFNRAKQVIANMKNSLVRKGFIVKREDSEWEIAPFLKNRIQKGDVLTLIIEFNVTE